MEQTRGVSLPVIHPHPRTRLISLHGRRDGLIELKQGLEQSCLRSKLFCGCETGRHPAATAPPQHANLWQMGCMEDCREVIFTRLRRHRASEELLRRIRRLNSVWARPTVKEKNNEKPICVHITYIIILRRSYDIRLSRDIAAVAVKFIFGLMMRVLEEEYATLLH